MPHVLANMTGKERGEVGRGGSRDNRRERNWRRVHFYRRRGVDPISRGGLLRRETRSRHCAVVLTAPCGGLSRAGSTGGHDAWRALEGGGRGGEEGDQGGSETKENDEEYDRRVSWCEVHGWMGGILGLRNCRYGKNLGVIRWDSMAFCVRQWWFCCLFSGLGVLFAYH